MPYNRVTSEHIEALRAVLDGGRLLAGEEIVEDYAHDELGDISRLPDVLIRVSSTREVSDILRYASGHSLPVVVRGSGTGLVGAAVAVEGGIMLETTAMNRILELDEDNLTVSVEPGVLLMDLAEYVEARGYLYPPDPGEKSATIGGNISTNAGGMRAVKYGVTRDYVRALTAVLPSGEVLQLGGKVVKNSSGYAIKDLLIGSEGTLAVITGAVLKLVPLPPVSLSLLVPYASMREALATVPHIVRSKAGPTAIEYMSQETILLAESYLGKRFPDTSAPAYLLLTFDGVSEEAVESLYEPVAELCLAQGAADVYLVDTPERKDSVWNARGAFLEAIKASTPKMDECDVVVPRDRIADFITFTHELAEKLDVRIPSFGHAGDGNLHIYICQDSLSDEQFRQKLAAAFDAMYALAAEYGGLVSGEHGIGWAKKPYLARQAGEEHMALMRGIKAAFDPQGILNPGKVC